MLNLSKVVRQLKNEREQTRAKLAQLDTALKVLGDVAATRPRANGTQDSRKTATHVSCC